MTKKEWPLVIFTLLIQMAVGTLFALATVIFIDQLHLPQDVLNALSITLLLAIPPLLILSVLSAILHLSRPGNTKIAMTNLKTSWLSREMLLGISFGALSSILCVVRLFEIGSPLVYNIILWAGILSGTLLLYGMSRIYMLRTVPAWNTWATPISFFISATLLGGFILSIAVSFVFQTAPNTENNFIAVTDLLRIMGWGLAILLTTQLFVAVIKDRYLIWKGGVSKESLQFLRQRYLTLGILRVIFGLLAIGLCVLFALQPFSNTAFILDVAVVIAFLLALTSETIGRFLFYASFEGSGL